MAEATTLHSFEGLLNKDEAVRAAFIKDPVGTLHKHGFALSAEQANMVKNQMNEMALAKIPTLPVRPGIVIEIRISIRF